MNTNARAAVFASMSLLAVSVPFFGMAFAESTRLERGDPQSVCLERQQRMGWSQAEYRACTDRQTRQNTRDVSGLACVGKTCQLRLKRTKAGLYNGSGFSLRLVLDAGESIVRGSLADTKGHRASLEQFCGASGCPSKPEWVSGDYLGATYMPIGDPTAPDSVILRLPRATIH